AEGTAGIADRDGAEAVSVTHLAALAGQQILIGPGHDDCGVVPNRGGSDVAQVAVARPLAKGYARGRLDAAADSERNVDHRARLLNSSRLQGLDEIGNRACLGEVRGGVDQA